MVGTTGEITALLKIAANGDEQARDRFFGLVYGQLRRLAGHYMRRERAEHTLQPTALVHEVYLRLFGKDQIGWRNHSHFVCGASRAMRQILVDHARRRNRAKRGGEANVVSLDQSAAAVYNDQPEILLALEECLRELESLDPRQARIVEMLYFTGSLRPRPHKLSDLRKSPSGGNGDLPKPG